MVTIALFGDSYIRRLRDFCHHDMKIPGNIRFFTKGGMKAKAVPDEIWNSLVEFRPDICFICIGGNDICHSSTPAETFNAVMDLVTQLRNLGTVVKVSEISKRGSFKKSPGLTHEEFEHQRRIINRRLRHSSGKNFVTFANIKYPTDYERDLVHFGGQNKRGLKKYFFAVRGILCAFKK